MLEMYCALISKYFSNLSYFVILHKFRVNHYRYWLYELRKNQKFPVMKISNELVLNKIKNKAFRSRVGPVFETCTAYLESSVRAAIKKDMEKSIGIDRMGY